MALVIYFFGVKVYVRLCTIKILFKNHFDITINFKLSLLKWLAHFNFSDIIPRQKRVDQSYVWQLAACWTWQFGISVSTTWKVHCTCTRIVLGPTRSMVLQYLVPSIPYLWNLVEVGGWDKLWAEIQTQTWGRHTTLLFGRSTASLPVVQISWGKGYIFVGHIFLTRYRWVALINRHGPSPRSDEMQTIIIIINTR